VFYKLTKIAADPIKLWKWAPKAFHPSYWTNCVQALTETKAYVEKIIEKSKRDLSAGKEPDCILENFRNYFFNKIVCENSVVNKRKNGVKN
jgi:hypothetical protein